MSQTHSQQARDAGFDPAQLLADELAGKYPDARGRFGPFGGRYIPETLVAAFEKLEAAIKQHLHAKDFQDELAGTENRLAVARKDYNDAVTVYNTTRQRFPTVLIAGLMGFQDKPFFKAEEGAKQVPKVDFSK